MPLIILGVDPGKMTGYSVYADDFVGSYQFAMDPFLDVIEAYLARARELGHEVVVACEDFKITMQTAKKSQGDRQWSLEQIGVLRHLCRRHDHIFELTSPSDAKRFATDDKIHAAGWWNKGHGHGNDATRQIITALGRRGIVIGVSRD